MTATTSYQAGQESSLTQLAYVQEAAWGVTPTAKLQAIRFTGESLSGQKTRQRPTEINLNRSASAAITTEESAGGGVDFGLSYGTYDDLLAGLFGGEWVSNVLTNGSVFKSFLLEKRFSSSVFFQYPGSYVGGGTLNIQRGQFLSGNFNFMSKEERVVTVSSSTGGTYTPAPTGRVMDPIGGIRDVMFDDAATDGICNSVSLNFTNEGAGGDYGLGSASAQGQRMGTFMAGGSVEFYFRTIGQYNRFKNEQASKFSFRTLDVAGNAYKFILPISNVMNPKINASGPNQAVMARYDLEAAPDTNGVHCRIERTPVA